MTIKTKTDRTEANGARKPVAPAARRAGSHLDPARNPLTAWRTVRAGQFTSEDLVAIKELLSRTALFGNSKWDEAVAGGVPSAIAVAVSFIPIAVITPQIDLALTALVRFAIEGDPAAAIVLSNILRNLPGGRAGHRRIATSWFVSNLAAAYAASAGESKKRRRSTAGTGSLS
jgi:hypothetical protein